MSGSRRGHEGLEEGFWDLSQKGRAVVDLVLQGGGRGEGVRLSTALGFEGGGLEGESVWEVSFPVSLRQDLKAKKNRNLKLFKAPPRVATAQFLRRVNRIVGLYKPGGFLAFINEKLLRDGGVWDAVQTGKDMPDCSTRFAANSQVRASYASPQTRSSCSLRACSSPSRFSGSRVSTFTTTSIDVRTMSISGQPLQE